MGERFRVVLCIKPVKTELVTHEQTSDQDYFTMNPFDLRALEVLTKNKRNKDNFILTCLCMGDNKSEAVLRRALAMGADEAILVSDKAFAGSDTVATSYILRKAMDQIENIKLIVCGVNTIDGETGQVPQAMAERLGIKQIVKGYEIESLDEDSFVFYDKDENVEQMLKSPFPALMKFTDFRTGIPSISLLAMKKAKSKEIKIFDRQSIQADLERCGLSGSKTQVLEVKGRISKKEKNVIEGDSLQIADFLNNLLGKIV